MPLKSRKEHYKTGRLIQSHKKTLEQLFITCKTSIYETPVYAELLDATNVQCSEPLLANWFLPS